MKINASYWHNLLFYACVCHLEMRKVMNVSIASRIVFVLKIEFMPVEYKVRLPITMYQCFLDRVHRE